jgi:hypothetical protein
VSKQHSSGGKDRLGSIGKQGDRYLRSLFMAGALAVIRYANLQHQASALAYGIVDAAGPTKVVAIALASKIARMAWAMMARGERYKEPVALPMPCRNGGNVRFEVRWSGGDIDRVRAFANELVKLAPDVILANGTPVIAMSADDSTATLQSGNGCAAGRPYAAPVKAEIARH